MAENCEYCEHPMDHQREDEAGRLCDICYGLSVAYNHQLVMDGTGQGSPGRGVTSWDVLHAVIRIGHLIRDDLRQR